MEIKNIEKDLKKRNKRIRTFKILGIIGSIVSGIYVFGMIIADDFEIEALFEFLFFLFLASLKVKE